MSGQKGEITTIAGYKFLQREIDNPGRSVMLNRAIGSGLAFVGGSLGVDAFFLNTIIQHTPNDADKISVFAYEVLFGALLMGLGGMLIQKGNSLREYTRGNK